jgi:hypothetical protein
MKNRIVLISLALVLALSIGPIGCGGGAVTYDLTIVSATGGSTSPAAGTHSYAGGVEVDLVATPDAGYRFVGWTGDVDTITNVNAASTIIIMNNDYSIAADFAVRRYSLTTSSTTGGSVTMPGEGTFTYDEGTVVNLVATPDAGYRFINWTGDVDSIANVSNSATTITMHDDYQITANFTAQYALTIDIGDGGMVITPDEGTSTYDAGTVVTLVAEAEEGYGFVKWAGDVSGIADINAAGTTITMNGHYSITASFGVAIYDWYDLDAIRNNLEGSYVLMNDLDATTVGYAQLAGPAANGGRGWDPLGTYGMWDAQQWKWAGDMFQGAFYGRGHQIRNLFINRPDDSQVGLFGHVNQGLLDDVGVTDSAVNGGSYAGGLVGWSSGATIRNCYYSGSVTSGAFAGGLAGFYHGSLSNSYYNHDQVLINGRHVITAGALFDGDFQQWLADGKVLDVNARLSQENGYYLIEDVSDFKQLLAFGQDSSLRFKLKNDLDLSNDANFYIPYLAADFDGDGHRISNLALYLNDNIVCHLGLFGINYGQVSDLGVENVMITTSSQYVGGLLGNNLHQGNVVRCYSTGAVTHGSGLVGGNWGTIVDSYSTAGQSLTRFSTPEGKITNSYSTCALVEWNRGTITSSFWDIQRCGEAPEGGGTGKTTAQLKSITTFSEAGWDISAVALGERNTAYVWNIVDGQTYPFLSWQPIS